MGVDLGGLALVFFGDEEGREFGVRFGDMQGNPVFFDHLNDGIGRRAIGEEGGYLCDGAATHHGIPPEFGVIGHQIGLARIGQNGGTRTDFLFVKVE